jgi:hypothetical protein
MLVREVDIALILLSRINPAVSNGDSLEREVWEVRRVEDRVGCREARISVMVLN